MPKKAKSCTCDLCCKPIIEGKDEALECEGECGKWYHRYCAGISMTHFKRLSTTTSPFVCFPCNQLVQEAKVSQLLSEVESLKSQLLKLEEELEESQRNGQSNQGGAAQQWSQVVKKKRTKSARRESVQTAPTKDSENRHQQMKRTLPQQQEPMLAGNPSAKLAKPTTPVPENRRYLGPKEAVLGARKVWGTLRATPDTAVSMVLKKLTTVGNQITVKRKYKKASATHSSKKVDKWWFVVRGDEEVLTKLEGEWDRVSLQTNWKLQPSYKFCDSSNGSTPPATSEPMPNDTSTPDKTSETVSGAQVSDNDNNDIASSSATPPFLGESLLQSRDQD